MGIKQVKSGIFRSNNSVEVCKKLKEPRAQIMCTAKKRFEIKTCQLPAYSFSPNTTNTMPLLVNPKNGKMNFSTKAVKGMYAAAYFDPNKIMEFTQCLAKKHPVLVVADNKNGGGAWSGVSDGTRKAAQAILKVVDYASLILIMTPGGLVAKVAMKFAPKLATTAGKEISKRTVTRAAAKVTTNSFTKAKVGFGSHFLVNQESLLNASGQIFVDWFGGDRWKVTAPVAAGIFILAGVFVKWKRTAVAAESFLQTVFAVSMGWHQNERIAAVSELENAKTHEARCIAQQKLNYMATGTYLFLGFSGLATVFNKGWVGNALCAMDDPMPALAQAAKNY